MSLSLYPPCFHGKLRMMLQIVRLRVNEGMNIIISMQSALFSFFQPCSILREYGELAGQQDTAAEIPGEKV